jgi:hypothetical protein
VIGHNESLQRPYFRELVPAFRVQTHSDFDRREMNIVRARRSAGLLGVPQANTAGTGGDRTSPNRFGLVPVAFAGQFKMNVIHESLPDVTHLTALALTHVTR